MDLGFSKKVRWFSNENRGGGSSYLDDPGEGGGGGRWRGRQLRAAVSASASASAAVRVRVWGGARLVGSGCGAAAYKRAGPRSPGRVRPEVGLTFF